MDILPPGSWEAFREWSINGAIIPEDFSEKVLIILKKEQLREIGAAIHKQYVRGFNVPFDGSSPFLEFPTIYFIGGLPLQPIGLVWRGNIGMRLTRVGDTRHWFPKTQRHYELLEGLPRFDEGEIPFSLMSIKQAQEEELREFDYVKDLKVKEQEMIDGK